MEELDDKMELEDSRKLAYLIKFTATQALFKFGKRIENYDTTKCEEREVEELLANLTLLNDLLHRWITKADQTTLYYHKSRLPSAFAITELLIRIRIQHEGPPSEITEVPDLLNGLRVTKEAQRLKGKTGVHLGGIPNMIAFGIRLSQRLDVPNDCLIAPTPEHWPQFHDMYVWAQKARQDRFNKLEVGVIDGLTTSFYQLSDEGVSSRDSLCEARKNAIDNAKLMGLQAKYPNVTAVVFNYPECDPCPSCFKCQGLFEFPVPSAYSGLEIEQLKTAWIAQGYGQPKAKNGQYPTMQCCEVLLHAICRRIEARIHLSWH